MTNHDTRTHKSTDEGRRQTNSHDPDDIGAFVSQNRDLLARVLARGNPEAQGYALAVVSKGGDIDDIEQIKQLLDDLKDAEQG